MTRVITRDDDDVTGHDSDMSPHVGVMSADVTVIAVDERFITRQDGGITLDGESSAAQEPPLSGRRDAVQRKPSALAATPRLINRDADHLAIVGSALRVVSGNDNSGDDA